MCECIRRDTKALKNPIWQDAVTGVAADLLGGACVLGTAGPASEPTACSKWLLELAAKFVECSIFWQSSL